MRTAASERNSFGRDSWGSTSPKSKSVEKELAEHLKHVRSILVQYLMKIPFTSKENEDLLPIVYSMLQFTKEEEDKIAGARFPETQKMAEAALKKGLFNRFNNKKKDKK